MNIHINKKNIRMYTYLLYIIFYIRVVSRKVKTL